MNVEAVSIPMTQTDAQGNVMEYRVKPLVFEDQRFKTLMDQLGRDLRMKFMKMYKKTKDIDSRAPAIEMSAWLAAFTFQQLLGWYGVLVEVTKDPKMSAMNTFNVFGETFKHLSAGMSESKQQAEPEPVDEVPTNDDEDVSVAEADDDVPMGEIPLPPDAPDAPESL